MSAKSMRGIGYKQGSEFLGSLERGGFNFELIQKVVNAPNNELAQELCIHVFNRTRKDNRFLLEKVILFQVPKHRGGYNPGAFVPKILEREKRYILKIFGISVPNRTWVPSKDCLAFLQSQDAILIGEEGVEAACNHDLGIKYRLDSKRDHVSFVEKQNCPIVDGEPHVPAVKMLFAPFWTPDGFQWSIGFSNEFTLLCFNELGE